MAEDINELRSRFPQIHPLVLEELETLTIRPRVENYDHHIYMVLHFPSFIEEHKKTVSYEVDFILMADTLITVQYDDIPTLEGFWHECEEEKNAGDQYGKSPIHLLYYLLRQFFAFSLRELDQIQAHIDSMEEKVFADREKEILEDISILKRNVLDFRRAVKPQHLTLESLVLQGTQLYGEKVKPFLTDLVGEYLKVWNLLENHKETLDALYDTNNSLLASKTNEIMRVFTILAFISFIPTAIANIYGMNIVRIPLSDQPNAFWNILGLMILTTGAVYAVLRWRKLV
ncbi:MAG: magnesium transporter CorA family protein [Candidatus Sungiibacteriota bacterium]|uniref:Magnesium transporter CorA family protein n=1 Tax=Candidatus Sungiibacteriota bacterium TaxID=2750080 RepID=A0A7T5RJI1_9BACT|nr:MAG: magnesium transporter CorA family protein [Candidatus Sungbacteria bacterium]